MLQSKYLKGYYRLLTPDVLYRWRCEPLAGATQYRADGGVELADLLLEEDQLLFRVPLVNRDDITSTVPSAPDDFVGFTPSKDLLDLTIDVTVALRYRSVDPAEVVGLDNSTRMTFLIVEREGSANTADAKPRGVGFQIRDPREYDDWGPYRGVEALCDDRAPAENQPEISSNLQSLIKESYLPDDRGTLGYLENLVTSTQAAARTVGPADIPDRFKITLKPNAFWGTCSSAVRGGHSVSVAPYFSNVDVRTGLYLDIYARKRLKNYYLLKYVEINLYT